MKNFRFTNAFSGTDNKTHTATLFGGFYDWDTPKTFRDIKAVRLDTGIEKSYIKEGVWAIKADKELIDKVLELVAEYNSKESNVYWMRPELYIESRRATVSKMFATMGSTGD